MEEQGQGQAGVEAGPPEPTPQHRQRGWDRYGKQRPAEELGPGVDRTRYADDEDGPEGELEARFSLTLAGEGGKPETLEVLQASESKDWWGRSEHTRGLVKLLGGPTSTLSDDIASVIANSAGAGGE